MNPRTCRTQSFPLLLVILCSNSAVPTCQIRGIDPTLQNSRKAHQAKPFMFDVTQQSQVCILYSLHEPLDLYREETFNGLFRCII
ncbi:hypothetical protein HDV57DRAFT_167404 [Trichoderma longibrachiatum]|uniref:Secreted protein n=1 Tax=Trichoderma longibrachiatum ATCC 18648 TaxID=983965 RepID=A0A2T4CA10_TRILO|nr:hypothetical protein M440DRAFT_1191645 [Trichoderma longibrachiatum ATCC 18648]